MIDTHTADGVKVGLEHREPGVPLICLETALPVKFAETIREALGREPEVPYGLAGLETLPQRFCVLDADVDCSQGPDYRATAREASDGLNRQSASTDRPPSRPWSGRRSRCGRRRSRRLHARWRG